MSTLFFNKKMSYTIIDERDGREASIWQNADGVRFNIVLRDIEADETIRVIHTRTYERAIDIMHSLMQYALYPM